VGSQAKGQEEVTRIIVCDTGPLLHLSEAGAAHLLSLAGKVLIPPLVATEFKANARMESAAVGTSGGFGKIWSAKSRAMDEN
jgi:hypothetical protein